MKRKWQCDCFDKEIFASDTGSGMLGSPQQWLSICPRPSPSQLVCRWNSLLTLQLWDYFEPPFTPSRCSVGQHLCPIYAEVWSTYSPPLKRRAESEVAGCLSSLLCYLPYVFPNQDSLSAGAEGREVTDLSKGAFQVFFFLPKCHEGKDYCKMLTRPDAYLQQILVLWNSSRLRLTLGRSSFSALWCNFWLRSLSFYWTSFRSWGTFGISPTSCMDVHDAPPNPMFIHV